VHTVVITHSHPDHFGGAARLREETGAEVLTHEAFRLWFERGGADDDLDDRPSDALDDPDAFARPTPWGTEFRPPNDDGGPAHAHGHASRTTTRHGPRSGWPTGRP
jgi:glyoxylase-like metal-dependent hydrolase (beta-lactamase superfamily II)